MRWITWTQARFEALLVEYPRARAARAARDAVAVLASQVEYGVHVMSIPTTSTRHRAPGGGRKPIGATRMPDESAVRIRLDAATRAYWQGSGKRGELSNAVRSLLTEVADGDAVVMSIDTAVHMAVAPWLAARLAEVEALDLDDTTLEDWLRGLLRALAEASQRRRR